MDRRKSLKILASSSFVVMMPPVFNACTTRTPPKPGLQQPASMYINWAAYDELSDDVFLNEKLALQQLDEVLRLKKMGVRFDYYLMDAFWFDPDGGYRMWRKNDWSDEGKSWLNKCQENDIKPGLWISTNWMVAGPGYKFLNVIPEWEDALSESGESFCLFEGGYLPHLLETMRIYANNGIKAFKFDFADFGAVTPKSSSLYSAEEVQQKNEAALHKGLFEFKMEHPDVVLMAYNGYGGQYSDTFSAFQPTVDSKWLEVFDTLYCGDPRLADIPTQNFWRSKDIYSDHMVQNYLKNGIPHSRIDNSAFMIGKTGTCYYRGKRAWKGMLILSAARGGSLNTYYGNLELLTEADAQWFAKVQQLYYPLQQSAQHSMIGGMPGKGEVYGFQHTVSEGMVLTLVNPKQSSETFSLPKNSAFEVLFADEGFQPTVKGNEVSIGAEQLLVLGSGKFTAESHGLGIGDYVRIPNQIKAVEIKYLEESHNQVTATYTPSSKETLRFIFQVFDDKGQPKRVSGGSPPEGTKLAELLNIKVEQGGQPLPLELEYDKAIWSGLSWVSAELKPENWQADSPLVISFQANIDEQVKVKGELFEVVYS